MARCYRCAVHDRLIPCCAMTLGCIAAFTVNSHCAAQPFEEAAEFGAGATIPIAWCDFDGDGDLDLAVGNYGRANELYVNNGDGTFEKRSEFGSGTTFAVVWADFDNDGDPDLAVANSAVGSYLYVNDGAGSFTQTTPFGSNRSVAMAWADYDLDGDLDLAVGNGITGIAGQNKLYVNQGNGTFIAEDQFGTEQTDTVAWGDFDNDGDPDLAVGNGGFSAPAQNYLYVNNGDGSFTGRAEFGIGDTASVAWGDADNDGDLDLAVGNWNAGQDYLYLNMGDGTFTEVAAFGARDANTVAWGDFDNDGDLDLAVGNGDFYNADQNYLYVNQSDGTFIETAEFGLGSTDSLAWGDYDNDGDLDCAAGNEHSPPQNYLYTNLRNPSAYLNVTTAGLFHRLGSGYSNRDGIGATIAIYTAGHLDDPAYLLGFREIGATGGFTSQNQHGAWFGLPGQDAVDLRITWPGSLGSRVTQTLTDLPISRTVVVTEASPLLSAPTPGSAGVINEFRVRGAMPGTTMTYVYSLQSGHTSVPSCPGLSLELKKPTLIGRAVADALGNATVTVKVPGPARGRTVYLQVIDTDNCVASNLVAHTFD